MKSKLLLLVAIVASFPFFASAQKFKDLPTIDLTISCDTLVAPDIFNLSITIIDNKGAGKKGIDEAEERVLIPTLKKIGIDTKKNLHISGFSSYYTKKGTTVASKVYDLKVTDFKTVNEITEKLTSEDILVKISSCSVSNSNEINEKLRMKGVKLAREQASILASADKCIAGRLLNISTNINYQSDSQSDSSNALYLSRGAVSMKGEGSSGIDSFRKIKISAYMTVIFELTKDIRF